MLQVNQRITNLLSNITSLDPIMTSILNNMLDGIIIKNENGKIIFINNKITEILGYLPEELIGLSNDEAINLLVGKFHDFDDIKDINDNRIKLKITNEVVARRRFTHKAGQAVPMEVHGFSIFNSDRKLFGELLLLRDLHNELLIKVINLVNSSLSLKEVLKNTTSAIVEYLGLASNAIFLLNKNKNELKMYSCNAYVSEEEIAKVVFKVGEGPPGKIAEEGKPIYVENLRTEESLPYHVRQFHGDKSSIGFPLVCKNELLGVIAFDADTVREFSSREIYLFNNIANQVALAIYNAQVFSQLEHLSITDGLTGIYNHRYFQDRLGEEIKRSNQRKNSFALLLIDVDNFKIYNDTFGHLLGDQLLIDLSQLIIKNVRNFDIVTRYGGEEFAVILLECKKDEAISIAERIRNAIEENKFYDNQKGPVTISIGLSMFPEEKSKHTLINNADKALYLAKKHGKNKVIVHQI